MSGLLYGLIVWMLLPPLLLHRCLSAAKLLLPVMGRLGCKSWAGPDLREQRVIGGYIVTQAHWCGLLGAILGALNSSRSQLAKR